MQSSGASQEIMLLLFLGWIAVALAVGFVSAMTFFLKIRDFSLKRFVYGAQFY
jgi:hypothetical protein